MPMFPSTVAQLVPNYREFPAGSESSFRLVMHDTRQKQLSSNDLRVLGHLFLEICIVLYMPILKSCSSDGSNKEAQHSNQPRTPFQMKLLAAEMLERL